MLWLAFSAFYQDTINVSLPKNFNPEVGLSPTKFNVDETCACQIGLKPTNLTIAW
jgi:hypothetical protein